MNKRLKGWYDTVGQGISDCILLAVLLYGDMLYAIEKTCKNIVYRNKIAKIHRQNPDITKLTKLAGIKKK